VQDIAEVLLEGLERADATDDSHTADLAPGV
jgi:hypothetical protein